MKFNQLETTFICQFNKPKNRAMLEGYKERKDKSGRELAQYYRDVFAALRNTPAFGVSGVNKMLNELTASVRATLNREKKGKTSAYAHAGKLLRYLDFYGNTEVEAKYNGRHKLAPTLSDEELQQLTMLA
jgi:hypothetical protein